MTSGQSLLLDLTALAVATLITKRLATSVLHPAWAMIGIHCYIVTFRLVILELGGSPMQQPFTWSVAESEIVRASLASDLGLLSMIFGCFLVRNQTRKHCLPSITAIPNRMLRYVALVSIPLGVLGLVLAGRIDQNERNISFATSGYLASTVAWAPWACCLLHYYKGFSPKLLVLTATALAGAAVFTPTRCAAVLPATFLLYLWITRRPSRSIPIAFYLGVIATILVWLPLKPITGNIYKGEPIANAITNGIRQTVDEATSSKGHIDTEFLDMIAATMSLEDLRGRWFLGGTIVPVLVGPIPRLLWPEKPRATEYLLELQTESRQLTKNGFTAGLVGEAYANAGYIGIVLTAVMLGALYGLLFRQALPTKKRSADQARSAQSLIYLVFLVSLPQVYRDGLASLVWFPFVYAAPPTLLAASLLLFRRKLRRIGAPLHSPRGKQSSFSSERERSADPGRRIALSARQGTTEATLRPSWLDVRARS